MVIVTEKSELGVVFTVPAFSLVVTVVVVTQGKYWDDYLLHNSLHAWVLILNQGKKIVTQNTMTSTQKGAHDFENKPLDLAIRPIRNSSSQGVSSLLLKQPAPKQAAAAHNQVTAACNRSLLKSLHDPKYLMPWELCERSQQTPP